jgi:hypothetical protein
MTRKLYAPQPYGLGASVIWGQGRLRTGLVWSLGVDNATIVVVPDAPADGESHVVLSVHKRDLTRNGGPLFVESVPRSAAQLRFRTGPNANALAA